MASEIQQIIFNNADPNASYSLHLTGHTEIFKFTAATTNSEFKTGIETLLAAVPALSSMAAIVTGGVLTGSTTKSGTKQIAFSGDVDVPTLLVRQGPVYHFLVEDGDADGDYSADGGDPVELGVSLEDWTANQQDIDTAHQNAVYIGSSTAPSGNGVVTVSGAPIIDFGTGPKDVNGDYPESGTANGLARYHKTGSDFWLTTISNGADYFYLTESQSPGSPPSPTSGGLNYYEQVADSDTVDGQLYRIADYAGSPVGQDPAPTVTLNVEDPTPGTADFTTYFQADATPSAPSCTGTGATNTTVVAAGSTPSTITVSTTQQGTAPAPAITSVSPTHDKPGQGVTLTGTNLSGVEAVEFSGRPARQFKIISDTEILAVVPPK